MEGMASALRLFGNIKKCHIIQFPNGRWGFVGNVPDSLCHKTWSAYQEVLVSNAYGTKEEAETALHETV